MSTLDALQQSGTTGTRLCYVLAIEGYDRLLTTHDDPSAVAAAWSATEWADALTGLAVHEGGSQSIEPWKDEIQVGSLRFSVLNETFARAVFASMAGDETRLTDSIGPDDGQIPAKSTDAFDSSGAAHIGIERFDYDFTGTSPTRFDGPVLRGRFAPFKADTETEQRFGRVHKLAEIDYGVEREPAISSEPRTWHRKMVGLWLHRIVGGQLDAKADAVCVWAGRISNVQSSGPAVVVDCQDIRGQVRDTTVMRDQFRGRLAPGMYLEEGIEFRIEENLIGSDAVQHVLTVDSGAIIEPGHHSAEEMTSLIGEWIASLMGSGDLAADYGVSIDGGGAFRLDGHSTDFGSFSFTAPKKVLAFLGFEYGLDDPGYGVEESFVVGQDPEHRRVRADDVPYTHVVNIEPGASIFIDATQGTFFDNTPYLPEKLADIVSDATGDVGILQIGDSLVLAEQIASDQFQLWLSKDLTGFEPSSLQIRANEDDTPPEIVQVALLEGSLEELVPMLFASTDGSGYNHADHDALPYGFGAAIPWELLGDGFINSLTNLAESTAPLRLFIEKPTKLWDVIGPDFLVRNAYLIWRDEALQWVTWSNAVDSVAEHNFTEDNKAHPADSDDDDRASVEIHRDWLTNIIKFRYNRDIASGEFRSLPISIIDQASIDDHGESKPITIELPNVFRDEDAEQLVGAFAADVVPMFSRPVRVVTRTIDHSLFEGVAPGDICTVTDDDVRDVHTGEMGIEGLAGIIISHEWDWGGEGADGEVRAQTGRVKIALNDRADRVPVYSPAAQVDGGVSSDTDIPCLDHRFSESSEDVDASRFATGDDITIISADPSSPGGATSFDRRVVSVSGSIIKVDSAVTLSASETWYIVSRDYATAQASQRSHAYQADDGDGLIQDLRQPYEWAKSQLGQNAFSSWSKTDYPERHSTAFFGDGQPVAVIFHDALARAHNSIINHRTQVSQPVLTNEELDPSGASGGGSGSEWELIYIFPFYVGAGSYITPTYRMLNAAPVFRSNDGTTAKVRITMSWSPPSSMDADDGADLSVPYNQLVFETTSTTLHTAATQQVPVVVTTENLGMGWITVEATTNTRLHGVGALYTTTYEP